MRVWVGLLCFALWAIAIMVGLLGDTPRWLQMAGWVIVSVYLLGSTFYLLLRPKHNHHQHWGEAALLPARWRRWVLDEPEPTIKPQTDD
jgi:hypothetical protein